MYSRSNRIWWSLERKERNNRNAILRPRSVGGAGAVLTVLPIDRQCGMIDMCDRVRRNHVTDRALAKWTSVRETRLWMRRPASQPATTVGQQHFVYRRPPLYCREMYVKFWIENTAVFSLCIAYTLSAAALICISRDCTYLLVNFYYYYHLH